MATQILDALKRLSELTLLTETTCVRHLSQPGQTSGKSLKLLSMLRRLTKGPFIEASAPSKAVRRSGS